MMRASRSGMPFIALSPRGASGEGGACTSRQRAVVAIDLTQRHFDRGRRIERMTEVRY
jgi:hypothetical protein